MSEQLTGRELDAEVAVKVMGWKPFVHMSYVQEHGINRGLVHPDRLLLFHKDPYSRSVGWKPEQLRPYTDADASLRNEVGGGFPPYSTDIAAAWQVVERMLGTPCRDGDHFHFQMHWHGKRWCAVFHHWLMTDDSDPVGLEWCEGHANTAPEAICRAALAAIGGPS